jgi:phosphatidate cytidylyltransferase
LAVSASRVHPARFASQALTRRVASGLVLAGLAMLVCWRGGWIFELVVSLVLLIALFEYLRKTVGGQPLVFATGMVMGGALLALAFLPGRSGPGTLLFGGALLLVLLSLRPPLEARIHELLLVVLGVLYIVGLGCHLIWLRGMEQGWPLLVVVLAGTWASDTGAFFTGVRFGRHPLAPRISPGKTVEGLGGGFLGAVAVVFLSARLFVPSLGLVPSLVLGLVLGAAAPVGDLFESLLKRSLGIKDFSGVIPGHGGMLDRIDSLLLTAPVTYHLLCLLGW